MRSMSIQEIFDGKYISLHMKELGISIFILFIRPIDCPKSLNDLSKMQNMINVVLSISLRNQHSP